MTYGKNSIKKGLVVLMVFAAISSFANLDQRGAQRLGALLLADAAGLAMGQNGGFVSKCEAGIPEDMMMVPCGSQRPCSVRTDKVVQALASYCATQASAKDEGSIKKVCEKKQQVVATCCAK